MGKKKNKDKVNKVKKDSKMNKHLLVMLWATIWLVWLIAFFVNISAPIWSTVNIDSQYNSATKNKNTKTNRVKKITSDKAWATVYDFYSNVNNANFNWYFLLFDKPVRYDESIRTYFSQVRIDSFLKKSNWGVKIQNISEKNDIASSSDYSIKRWFNYTLKYRVDWVNYSEDWEMILMSYDGWKKFFVNSLFCTTEDCSKLPFYN